MGSARNSSAQTISLSLKLVIIYKGKEMEYLWFFIEMELYRKGGSFWTYGVG